MWHIRHFRLGCCCLSPAHLLFRFTVPAPFGITEQTFIPPKSGAKPSFNYRLYHWGGSPAGPELRAALTSVSTRDEIHRYNARFTATTIRFYTVGAIAHALRWHVWGYCKGLPGRFYHVGSLKTSCRFRYLQEGRG